MARGRSDFLDVVHRSTQFPPDARAVSLFELMVNARSAREPSRRLIRTAGTHDALDDFGRRHALAHDGCCIGPAGAVGLVRLIADKDDRTRSRRHAGNQLEKPILFTAKSQGLDQSDIWLRTRQQGSPRSEIRCHAAPLDSAARGKQARKRFGDRYERVQESNTWLSDRFREMSPAKPAENAGREGLCPGDMKWRPGPS